MLIVENRKKGEKKSTILPLYKIISRLTLGDLIFFFVWI